jgi:hypothetical protein
VRSIVDKLRGLKVKAEKVAIIHGPIPSGLLAEGKAIGTATGRLRQASAKVEMQKSSAIVLTFHKAIGGMRWQKIDDITSWWATSQLIIRSLDCMQQTTPYHSYARKGCQW